MRPISPVDKAALEGAFERLSPESRYRRFLSQTPRLSARDLEYLTEVDHRCHEAVIAFDVATGEAVGTARYVCDSSDERIAEPALTVVDAWQRRGLGSVLLERLIGRARAQGVCEFRATVLADNEPMLQLLRASPEIDELEVSRAAQGTVEVRAGLGSPLDSER
jgi:GNAT superfamily N-acetyltransferase